MRTLITLLFATLAATAQEYIFTPDRSIAEAYVAKLDSECGYPNPATNTMTAVNIQELVSDPAIKGGTAITNYVVLVPSVYAPKVGSYIDAKMTLPSTKRTALTDEASVTIEMGKASGTNRYVLVTKEIAETAMKVAETNVVKEPPIGTK